MAVNKLYLILVFFFGTVLAFASDSPPVPNPMGRRRPPPPPGLPLDEHILMAIAIALFFGIYIIYNYNLKAKTPM